MEVQNFTSGDCSEVIVLIDKCRPYVIPYHVYAYWILKNYFGSVCKIARDGTQIVGFVSALPSMEKDTLFIWQLAVDPACRRLGIGSHLLQAVREEAIRLGFKSLQYSISDGNFASEATFQRFSEKTHLNTSIIEKLTSVGMKETVYQIDL